jgi:hypothetical protein
MFGVSSNALVGDVTTNISAYIAAASRWIDAFTGKDFTPNTDITEQHNWDPVTRRIPVNNSPILSVSDYRIFIGPSNSASFPVSALYINNQENWVELASMTAAGSLTNALLTIGLYSPVVSITYKSHNDVKPNIKLATGYILGAMINQGIMQRALPPGLQSIQIGEVRAVRMNNSKTGAGGTLEVPDIVTMILNNEITIGIA